MLRAIPHRTRLSRAVNLLPLESEDIILSCTASYDVGLAFSCWRPGLLYLSARRLFFVQVKKTLFQIFLKDIQNIEIEKRSWVLGKKVNQLHICWQTDRARNVFIAVRDCQDWKHAIETVNKQKLLVDVFEEDNEIVVMVELPTVCEDEIDVKVEEKKIIIAFKDADGIQRVEEVFLSSEVFPAQFSKIFHNQVLEIQLVKKNEFSYEKGIKCKNELRL